MLSEKMEIQNLGELKIKEYSQDVKLLDGRKANLRTIRSSDKAAISALYHRLSDTSIFLRYHYYKKQLTENDLRNFCDLDYIDNLALVAEIKTVESKEVVGVGLFNRLPNSNMAEVAFVVQDSEQQKGIGTLFLKHLSILARERGIKYFCGEVLRQNIVMLTIFKKSDPTLQQIIDNHTTCMITLSVDEVLRNLA